MADYDASCTEWYEVIVCGWFNMDLCRGITHNPVHVVEEFDNVLCLTRTTNDLNGEGVGGENHNNKQNPSYYLAILTDLSNAIQARSEVE